MSSAPLHVNIALSDAAHRYANDNRRIRVNVGQILRRNPNTSDVYVVAKDFGEEFRNAMDQACNKLDVPRDTPVGLFLSGPVSSYNLVIRLILDGVERGERAAVEILGSASFRPNILLRQLIQQLDAQDTTTNDSSVDGEDDEDEEEEEEELNIEE